MEKQQVKLLSMANSMAMPRPNTGESSINMPADDEVKKLQKKLKAKKAMMDCLMAKVNQDRKDVSKFVKKQQQEKREE